MREFEKMAETAWNNFQKDGRKFRQTLTDKEGEPHYILCYSHDSTVIIHGIWNKKTGNYCVRRFKMEIKLTNQ